MRTLNELIHIALFYVQNRPLVLDDKAAKLLTDDARRLLAQLSDFLAALDPWSTDNIGAAIHDFADKESVKLGQIAQPLRAALCGTTASPGIFEVAGILGKDEVLGRLGDVMAT